MSDKNLLRDILRAHLTRIEHDAQRLILLRDRLRSIAHADMHLDPEAMLATLDAMSRIERHVRGRARTTAKQGRSAENRWRALGKELRACMTAGDHPNAPRAQAAAAQAQILLDEFAGGDAKVLAALARLRSVDPPRGLAGWDPDLIRDLDAALAVGSDK